VKDWAVVFRSKIGTNVTIGVRAYIDGHLAPGTIVPDRTIMIRDKIVGWSSGELTSIHVRTVRFVWTADGLGRRAFFADCLALRATRRSERVVGPVPGPVACGLVRRSRMRTTSTWVCTRVRSQALAHGERR
jgi:hypothetical protein